MSETAKTYTAREMVMARRLGFVDGADFEMRAWQRFMHVTHRSGADSIEGARARYPIPKITRPRTWADQLSGLEYRVVNGTVQSKFIGHGDERWHVSPCASMIAALADLLAHPTEEVEDDA